MGKAAWRQKSRQVKYLKDLFDKNPNLFASQWEHRLDSWLIEIRLAAKEWKKGGANSKARIFLILDRALKTLAACGEDIYAAHAGQTYKILCGECCASVAGIMEPRLYRLSNTHRIPYLSRSDKQSRR